MTYKNWKKWVSQLPLSLRWFIVLILLRPIIDLFYFLKEISPLISPLYIVGILTPLFIIFSFLSKKFPQRIKSLICDLNFGMWSLLVAFNLSLLFLIDSGFEVISDVLKYSTPLFLFYFFRHFIRSKVDLIGVLQTFLYSAYIPAILLVYELLFGAISPEYLSEGRGGGARIQGGYADIMNYAIYATGALLIQCYFFLRSNQLKAVTSKKTINLILVIIMSFVAFLSIKQTSSWAVALFLFALFIFYNLKSIKGFLIILLFSPLLFFIGFNTFKDKIEPLIEKEYKVIEGDAGIERSFNGRMTRWIKYFEIWTEMPLSSNLLGAPLSNEKEVPTMISGGMHSDFVRVLFLSGVTGFLLYLSFLMLIFKRGFGLPVPEKFLIFSAVVATLLYSVSATPLLYVPYLYYILPIFSYAALPKPILQLNEKK